MELELPLLKERLSLIIYALYDYEFYGQDSWKIKSNLTFNYGLRYQWITPPWETNGQEVAPTMNLGKWFGQRQANMLQGIPSNQDPLVSFDLAGRSNGRPDLWPTQKKNFAPRVSLAWSPAPKVGWLQRLFGNGSQSVIRAGFGMYYDNFGQGMLSTFVSSGGSFGLASTLSNPAGCETVGNKSPCPNGGIAPRVSGTTASGMNSIPTTDNSGNTIFVPAPPANFPQTFPSTLSTGGFCICWGLDSSIKSPYSYALNLSFQRELPGNMSIEVGYVGHLGHRLLAQDDLAMPLDFVDPKSKIDYFSAATALAKIYRTGVPTGSVTAAMVGPAAQYWQNMIQPLQPGDQYSIGSCTGTGGPTGTTSALQAAYDLFCGGSTNETTPLFVLDYFGIPGTKTDSKGNPINSYFPTPGTNTFFNPQYSSLYAWRSIGFSHYHALQVTLHKRMSHGLRFDLNYVYSRSIDLASDAERVPQWGGLGGNIINAWSPYQLKGVSDFDLTHQINANWTLDLPFGRGRAFGKDMGKGLDAVIGGWELSGISRWSSGFPVNVAHGFEWPTNWQLSGEATTLSHPPTGRTDIGGNWNIFTNQANALAAFGYPFPGQSGARNAIRGDGFLNTDMTLAKIWKMPYNENHALELRWDVFNVFNTKRFDVQTAQLELDSASNFGDYTHLLTNPRQMEFGLRYQF
ncbi:MAG: outer membrane beta-barrel protein [Candidatus Acidiferrales bacterium]